MLRFLYYAAAHPERNEKMSFEDMIQLAGEASRSGLLPEGLSVETMMGGFVNQEETADSGMDALDAPIAPAAFPEITQEDTVWREDMEKPVKETVLPEKNPLDLAEIAKPTVDESGEDPYQLRGKYSFTKKELNTPMNSAEIAEYLGFSKSQSSAAFSMAKKTNGTMTPDEFINYMINKVLSNKILRRMISDKQAEGLYYIRKEMDAVLSAPDIPAVPVEPVIVCQEITEKVDSSLPPVVEPESAQPVVHASIQPEIPAPVRITPMERLAEMYASGQKYSATRIFKALQRAGIDKVDESTVNLMFTYYGSRHGFNDSIRMSLDGLIDFLSSEVAVRDDYSAFLDDSTRAMLLGLREMVDGRMKMLRKTDWLMAAIVTGYPLESDETFGFVEKVLSEGNDEFGAGNFYLVGESVMYKEMKDGFRRELVFLTLLTVFSIFLIVAFTFKSALIPAILVMTVMTGVNINVFFSGLGDHTMLYLAYLIVQSILMGATIDYGILFTNYYLGFRRGGEDKAGALKNAYRGSIHTIMTSGLIIVVAPFIMSELLTDPTICSILSSLTFGALAVLLLIVFVLPGVLAASDRIIFHGRDGQIESKK